MRRTLAGVAILLTFTATAVLSQAPDPPKSGSVWKQFTRDAVSIRLHKQLDSGGSLYMHSDGFEINNLTLHSLFWSAFDFRSEEAQVAGWPAWANSDHFDIQAKMSPEDAEIFQKLPGDERNRQWRQITRQILEERFAMKAHVEKRELPVYELVVAKQGSKLKQSGPDTNGLSNYGAGKIPAKATEIRSFISNLSSNLGRVVIDKTGLTGTYDFELTWAPDNQPDVGPSIFTALQEQLGLKLQSARAPVDVVVIDHLERPSEN